MPPATCCSNVHSRVLHALYLGWLLLPTLLTANALRYPTTARRRRLGQDHLERFKPTCYTHGCLRDSSLNGTSWGSPKVLHSIVKNRTTVTCDQRDRVLSWAASNPDFLLWVHDDHDCLRLVEESFSSYLEFYEALWKPIERSDICRYALMFAHGGVYFDSDAACLRPVELWGKQFLSQRGPADGPSDAGNASARHHHEGPSVWLGLESMIENETLAKLYQHHYPFQLLQWTLASKPHVKFWTHLIEAAIQSTAVFLLNHCPGKEKELGTNTSAVSDAYYHSLVARTGPGRLTHVLRAMYLHSTGRQLGAADVEKGLVWRKFEILPLHYWGWAGAGKYVPNEMLVQHHFDGTWKVDGRPQVPCAYWK